MKNTMHRISSGRGAARLSPTNFPQLAVGRQPSCTLSNQGRHSFSRKSTLCLCATKSLAELELCAILNTEGYIAPPVLETTKASIFAIFDEKKSLQYIGFSRDLDSSLKLVFTRRPDKSYFYKSCDLDVLDQEEMIKIRDAWFEEVGGPPIGNSLALERTLWQEPAESNAINARAKMSAAEEKAKSILIDIKARGCKGDFIADPVKLVEGKIDFLPTKKLSAEDIAAKKAERDAIARASRTAMITVNGAEEEISVFFEGSYDTNGGRMFDIVVGHDGRDTTHRVVIGRQYYEPNNVEAEEVVMFAMGYLISEGEPRHTEGLLETSQFPVNYFSMSELDQRFPEFSNKFALKFGELQADGFWRFNRVTSYGEMYERVESLAAALSDDLLPEEQRKALAESTSEADDTNSG